jgi:hypothetical protein
VLLRVLLVRLWLLLLFLVLLLLLMETWQKHPHLLVSDSKECIDHVGWGEGVK